ncbi:MAG: hypothetical protein BWY72_01951 [Bacteroidetes bacterium ADurb.Bin416]|nr:MAG: hypothetical protein BWY72_01951 [Bacteroidetes bacterium ADurb.Bin416]
MSGVDELFVSGNQVVGRLRPVGGITQVVHTFKNDGPFHAGLVEDVPFKTTDT